ncbi:hypothetical protein SB49_11705 [Sediminicola sp. YIK13]|uniref:outer membrane beta-barrel protein n=1 Tax=Sediminicola sp. YIK13 TaxID=1453352 RepID=UPI0007230697|nr:outer membrane beta-barrel protein [Sediminicola sp. YIK13]ALM08401.1 hypothetical protein SB49_11705 [Sediminicola sp. YIK13]
MKKNLDNLFQEKLNDIHELPNENVWKSIEASLDKNKKSRRVLPLWWTLGGVAALLAILFYVAQPGTTDLNSNSIITDTEKKILATPVGSVENKRDMESQEEALTASEAPEKDQNTANSGNLETRQQENSWAASSSNPKAPSKLNGSASSNITNPAKENNKGVTIASSNPKEPSNALGQKKKNNSILAISDTQKENISPDYLLKMDAKKNTMDPNFLSSQATKIANQEPKTPIAKKSIYDEINTQEKENIIADTESKKWSLEPSVAPVYFNGFGSGSPIHPEFSSNSKSGNVNLSYGVFVSYEVSKKLSVRSGVHKVDYGYNTNDVNFTSSFATTGKSSLANIDYADNANNLIVVSTNNVKPSANIQGEVSGKTPSKNGSMIQQFGYLEIPLELNYALLDKDFGISLVGGFSSLFLTNNAVLLEADGLNTEIGEANNINDINFSSNIGFGLNYKFTPKIKLNIEPVFKYQLNTFSNSAGDFKPFSVGIYSGFNFKF